MVGSFRLKSLSTMLVVSALVGASLTYVAQKSGGGRLALIDQTQCVAPSNQQSGVVFVGCGGFF